MGCEIVLWSVPSSLLPTCGQGGEDWRASPGAVGALLSGGQKAGGVLSPALELRRQSIALCGLPGGRLTPPQLSWLHGDSHSRKYLLFLLRSDRSVLC